MVIGAVLTESAIRIDQAGDPILEFPHPQVQPALPFGLRLEQCCQIAFDKVIIRSEVL